MAKSNENEISDLNKEFADQLDKLSLHLTSLACNESLATSRLNSLVGRQEKTLEKMEAIEKAKFENEQGFQQKMALRNGQRLRAVKRPKEVLFKRGEKEKILQKLRLSEKENQAVKEQLRIQLVQVMKLEARLANYEAKSKEEADKLKNKRRQQGVTESPVKKRKFGQIMRSFKEDFCQLRITLTNVNKRKEQLAGINGLLQVRMNKLIKELDSVKVENYRILCQNKQLLAYLNIQKISVKADEASDNDLLLAQLEQENEVLASELKDAKERESIWRKQVEMFKNINEDVEVVMDKA